MTVFEKEIIAWLLTVPGIGQRSCWRLLTWCRRQNYSITEWWRHKVVPKASFNDEQYAQVHQRLLAAPLNNFKNQLQQYHVTLLDAEDPTYPFLLKEIPDKPLLLFVTGREIHDLQIPVAVVGTRKITAYGKLVTKKIVSELVEDGVSIISGGMYGVDLLAHQVAVARQAATIAVLGFGFGRWYPQEYFSDSQQLLAAGATFISEYPPLTPPSKASFPVRNRLIAGMSLGVVVTEAGLRSGSHITAECALEYGREVMAVPGPITNPYSSGTAGLINEGATLISSGQEVLKQLGVTGISSPVANMHYNTHQHQPLAEKVLETLESRASTLDELAESTNSSLPALFSVMTMLEIEGKVIQSGVIWHVQ